MVMAQTSINAYRSIVHLGAKQREVLEKIEEIEPCDNQQIAKALGWEINRVTGRVNELAKKKLIQVAYYGPNSTGRKAKFWEIKEEY